MCWGSCSLGAPQGFSGVEEVLGISILCCLVRGISTSLCFYYFPLHFRTFLPAFMLYPDRLVC